MGAVVVYDVTNRESYDNLPTWIEGCRSLASKDVVLMLVGNKVDLAEAQEGARQVPFLESSQLAQEHHTMLLESSAREPPRYRCHLGCILLKTPAISLRTGTGVSVEEVFMTVAKSILNKRLDLAAQAEREARPESVAIKPAWRRGAACDGGAKIC